MSTTPSMRPLSPAGAHVGRVCAMCNGKVFERVQRTTLVQRHILPFFNLYPWRCVVCHKLVYLAQRSTRPERTHR